VRAWKKWFRFYGPVLGVIALGGGLGSVARYGIAMALPATSRGFPWATFVTNVLGCFLIGILMVLVVEVWSAQRLVRPFLGVGVLGGFTTFSTYVEETLELMRPGRVLVAFSYLIGTVICALLAVTIGGWLSAWATERVRSPRRREVHIDTYEQLPAPEGSSAQ
jgi:CrcB protein